MSRVRSRLNTWTIVTLTIGMMVVVMPAQAQVDVAVDGDQVPGGTVTATVTSFRTVEWDSFSPNFFMVFSPGVLDGYPATYISSVYLDENQKRVVLDMMREFPSVTAIDLDAVLGQVRDVMDKAALAVQAVFVFTLLAGLTVLWAAVQATRDERRYESAMLRTFGASRNRVLGGVVVEFVAIGLLAGLLAAMRHTEAELCDQRILFYGAGSAAVGIADMICAGIAEEHNMTLEEARRLVWMVDSHGLVSTRREGELQEHKVPYAQDEDPAPTLPDVIQRVKPTVLIGCSGQPRTFTEDVIKSMYAHCPEPVIFALSNPTSKSECTAEEAYTWTEGNAIFASGSPFRRVRLGGRIFIPGQGNNMFIFPGMGLGAIVSGASKITDEMFFTAAKTLAHMVTDEELAAGTLYPDLSKIRQISLAIAASVCRLAWDRGLARYEEPEDIREAVRAAMWHPEYRPYVAV